MTWNQLNSENKNHDPWGSNNEENTNNYKNGNSEKNKKCKKKKLTDLNNIFLKIRKRIGKLGKNKLHFYQNKRSHSHISIFILVTIFISTTFFWTISGFYTIKEAERGVVTRLGKFNRIVNPGLNWHPKFIDEITSVNVESVRELAASGVMLTSDENVVRVEMNVQYRVTDPKRYLFSVTNADNSLSEATDSALRGVIGKYTMDRILTEGRTVIRSDTQRELEDTIRPYNMGITLLDVNFQTARPPEEVKAAFDDAIAARENEQQYIREAEAYINEVKPKANGQARRILEQARAYRTKTILEAKGEVARFTKILPEYKSAPKITRERLYIETMEKVLSHSRKILVSKGKEGSRFCLIINSDQIYKENNSLKKNDKLKKGLPYISSVSRNNLTKSNSIISTVTPKKNDIMEQRRTSSHRNSYQS